MVLIIRTVLSIFCIQDQLNKTIVTNILLLKSQSHDDYNTSIEFD